MQVLIGTTNPAKLKFFQDALSEYDVDLVTLNDLGITAEPGETGRNPGENAAIKAAFYGKYADYVICNDAGLYFDALPLDDPRQPGLHIRTPFGRRLDDEEMIAHYSHLVHSLGGKVMAYYLDGFAVKTPEGVHSFLKSQEHARLSAFWMVDKPVAARRPGWPLDSLSMEFDETSFMQEGVKLKPSLTGEARRAWVSFLATELGLTPLEAK